MALHVVVGSGPVGSAVARRLLNDGEKVRVISRSGSGPDGTDRVAADAGNTERLRELTDGAVAIYNCVNPPYDRWAKEWPPVARALLAAAESSGAVLATTANLYVYGPVAGPMTEDTPMATTGRKGLIRKQMTEDAFAAHRAGRIRAVEVRGSDYLGGNSILSALLTPALRKGRRAYVPADLDAPRTWTCTEDMADMLVTAARDERAWGQVWHAPSNEPVSIRSIAEIAAAQLGTTAKVSAMPYGVLWAAGLFNAMARELRETQYQFRAPFVMDSSKAQQTFGLRPTPLEDAVRLDLARS